MQQPFDAITDEVHRWEVLDRSLLKEFMDEDGLLNEFALLYKLRTSFPLHYTVFRQRLRHIFHMMRPTPSNYFLPQETYQTTMGR